MQVDGAAANDSSTRIVGGKNESCAFFPIQLLHRFQNGLGCDRVEVGRTIPLSPTEVCLPSRDRHPLTLTAREFKGRVGAGGAWTVLPYQPFLVIRIPFRPSRYRFLSSKVTMTFSSNVRTGFKLEGFLNTKLLP
ncbi:MAG: hypothetical protein R3B54_07305 [Bdellovibrionota bacterium]